VQELLGQLHDDDVWIEYLPRFLEDEARRAVEFTGSAKAMRKLGNLAACVQALEDFLATSPLDEEANLLLGQVLEEAGHLRSARAVYEYLSEIAPRNPEGLKRAGAILQRGGEHARALEYYERALRADPRDQEALKARKNLAAETALARSSAPEVQHSRDLIRDKEEARGLERSQRLHLSEDELRAELQRFELRLAAAPNDPDLLLATADVHERLKDLEAALELARRALEYRRTNFELVSKVGDLESKSLKKRIARADRGGDTELANRLERELIEQEVADARRRLELRPQDPGLRLSLSQRLLKAGDVDAALSELQRCQDEPRVRAEALFCLGQCFQRKGILDLAKKDYEQALAASPGKSERAKEILYHLGTIAESQGNSSEARSYFIRIYEVDIGYRDVAAKMESLK
jgi:tetratricopeptide (TPR) repeat protein